MEKVVIQLTINGILDQANQMFGDLLNGTIDRVGKLTETIDSVTAGL